MPCSPVALLFYICVNVQPAALISSFISIALQFSISAHPFFPLVPSLVRQQYGLYASFMGAFVYVFLGTAKDVTLGPTAIMSLLVASNAEKKDASGASHTPVADAMFLSFFGGLIQIAMGLLRLGKERRAASWIRIFVRDTSSPNATDFPPQASWSTLFPSRPSTDSRQRRPLRSSSRSSSRYLA